MTKRASFTKWTGASASLLYHTGRAVVLTDVATAGQRVSFVASA